MSDTFVTRRKIVASGLGLALSGSASAAPVPDPHRESRFEIDGPRLSFGGKPIRLVGVAVGDPIYIRPNRPAEDYVILREDWRANCVRISLHPGHWRADRAGAREALLREVSLTRAVGLFAIVNWHAMGFPGRYIERPDPEWGLPPDIYDPDEALATDFWTAISTALGDDPGVIFEIWNEPVVDPRLWVSTGEHWRLMKPLWARLTAVIRRRSDNLVLVTGGRWAHDLKGVARDLMPDPRTAYAWHCYPRATVTDRDDWAHSLDGLPAVRPVVVTEWGFTPGGNMHLRGTAADFGVPLRDGVLDRLGLHSTAWCWSPGAAPQMLEADWRRLTAFGAFVKDYLARQAR
jgi:hypothetical protein